MSNKTFMLHVRDAPGGEEFMHETGWRISVSTREGLWWRGRVGRGSLLPRQVPGACSCCVLAGLGKVLS